MSRSGPKFRFGAFSGPNSDGCGANGAVEVGKDFVDAAEWPLTSSSGWINNQDNIVDSDISIRRCPF
jgi:hypothetical protein